MAIDPGLIALLFQAGIPLAATTIDTFSRPKAPQNVQPITQDMQDPRLVGNPKQRLYKNLTNY